MYRIYEGDEPSEEVKFHQDELGATSNTFHQDESFHYGDELDLFYNSHQGNDCFKNDRFQQYITSHQEDEFT